MSVITVGDFDGVHLGHRELLTRTAALAERLGEASIALTFDRNSKFALRGSPQLRLASDEERERLILSCGIDRVVCIPFTERFAALSPEAFLDLLRERYGCTALVGGADFRFGSGAQGRLTDGKIVCGIRQYVIPLKTDTEKISSSAVRQALSLGDVSRAAELLGRYYSLSGSVVHGKRVGHRLGFPTINLKFSPERALPADGVYITETHMDGIVCRSVTNVGHRPTVEDAGRRTVETHLIGADGDFYGRCADVLFFSRLREEKKFSGLSDLAVQLSRDREDALHFVENAQKE